MEDDSAGAETPDFEFPQDDFRSAAVFAQDKTKSAFPWRPGAKVLLMALIWTKSTRSTRGAENSNFGVSRPPSGSFAGSSSGFSSSAEVVIQKRLRCKAPITIVLVAMLLTTPSII